MSANPVLAELERGNAVENIHRGAIAIVDDTGAAIASAGDIDRPVFPRSAIKSMQALALFQSGAVDKFSLTEEAIALACASHQGEPAHLSGVRKTLSLLGLTADDLECGVHRSGNVATRNAMQAAGELPTTLNNNCSGKHAGMLADALALGVPTKDYVKRDHPVQKLVRSGVEAIIGADLSTDRCGVDGCSIPTWAAPLRDFAKGFARMQTGKGLDPQIAAATRKIFDAATNNPFLVQGTNGLDTDLMTAFGGRLMIKGGAEGVYCGCLRDRGWGFALKVDDGNMFAVAVIVSALLLAISDPNEDERAALEKRARHVFTNWRKIDVGVLQATAAARLAI